VHRISDRQARMLMEESRKCGRVGKAAMKAGVHRNTATKYLNAGKLPSEMQSQRTWRTRPDPFADVWEREIETRLVDAPELEAKTLFEHLVAITEPGTYEPGQLRTLQRRVHEWRARNGPDKEVMFPQAHRPGEALQTDFTWATELGITIRREPFPHMLCHMVLPYSNWEWATVCRSESLLALRTGVQAALFRLGRVPEWHQTDNSTAATHTPAVGDRKFNEEYEALMRHLGMKPRTIKVGKKNQNGDVEALNGALKRRLVQHLAMRGSKDFGSDLAYRAWLEAALDKANGLRITKVNEELAVMKVLQVSRLPEYREVTVGVKRPSTIRVMKNAYSVPARLIGEDVQVRVFDDHLEIFYRAEHQLTVPRLIGEGKHAVNYRHVIWWLVQKPAAFRGYVYREDMFPALAFRQAYDRLVEHLGERRGDLEYLRVLHLAATMMESEVEEALKLLAEESQLPTHDQVKSLAAPTAPAIPQLAPLQVDLTSYDQLLAAGGEA
jgi:transposase InsO family protein